MGNKVVPLYSNRGAQNTYKSGLRACVDWVQATFKNVEVSQLITDILKLDFDSFYEAERGSLGYKKCKKYGHISVFYDGKEDMGVHLQMTGQGCREYEALGKSTWKELFFDSFCYNVNFTRLDIAIDDFEGYFKISSLKRKIKDRLLVSKFKDATNIEKVNIDTGESKGETIYYGSSQSRIQIRMYEKNFERKNKGHELEEGLKVWNRTEVQARDERANKIAEIIMLNEEGSETVGQVVAGILKYYLRFTVKGKDSNRSRWKTAPFWDKFLGNVEALRLTDVAPDRTVEKTFNWVSNQVAPSLAVLMEAYEGDMDILKRFALEGKERLTDKEYKMIEAFKKEQKNSLSRDTE
ncbi:replication initiation factor domain-containing protein [Priestia aryabhattai]|uniref:Replication initiation factor domain-containing protein n=1 Tax=Priestia aryabhattai TaxID=412384 RepID=A0ABD5L3G7_PRIAR